MDRDIVKAVQGELDAMQFRAKDRNFGILSNEERQMLVRHGYQLAMEEVQTMVKLAIEIDEEIQDDVEVASQKTGAEHPMTKNGKMH